MIDTLKVYLPEFQVADNSSLTIQPSAYRSDTGELLSDFKLYENEEGEITSGSKAYLNTEDFNLTIGARGAFVQFSIPKVAHKGNNIYWASKDEASSAILKVEEGLFQAGLYADLRKGDISRIDTFANVEASEPFSSYSGVFSLLRGSRKFKRDYGTTILWGNTQAELTIYDKNEELKRRRLSGVADKNLLRFEYRLLNKKKSEKILGFSKVEEIPDRWDELKEKYKQAWSSDVFKYETDQAEVLASGQLSEELLFFKKKYGRNYFSQYLQSFGANELGRMVSPEALALAIEYIERDESEDTRRKKKERAIRIIEDRRRMVAFLRKDEGVKTWAELYDELKDKVLAV
jgi:hypothetical protein